MNWHQLVRLLIFPAILGGCFAAVAVTEASPRTYGVLSGSVSRWPLTPNEPARRPERRAQVSGARIEVATMKGTPVTAVETDSGGNFRVELPPGTYRLTMRGLHGVRPRNLPSTVTIAAGHEERLDILMDSGLR
jgi:hypothetical protein